MPDKPLTVITYAASASLAAVALVYFFSPNYLFDGVASAFSAGDRKNGVVGLSNFGNDCFINCSLQALAGLGDLRLYLIRELHRRKLDSEAIYSRLSEGLADGKQRDKRKALSLLNAEVTRGLKDMLDGLNERPIYRKTISAAAFIRVLEHAFDASISRNQQDAQELLQVIAERLAEEYAAGREARKRSREGKIGRAPGIQEEHSSLEQESAATGQTQETVRVPTSIEGNTLAEEDQDATPDEEENGFPLEGRTQSQIECQHCHFIPKSIPASFVMLTLTVPYKSSTTLNECFDAHFKTEYIDDYKCDKCRLQHAVDSLTKELTRASSDRQKKASVEADIEQLRKALDNDPGNPPKNVQLPDSKLAPARCIARHISITSFPSVLVVHLSRSIFDLRSYSSKNTAKVVFPERLPLGSLLNRRNYKLLAVIAHKGTHNSGHYETFRRQHVYAPVSNPHADRKAGPYASPHSTKPNPSPAPGASRDGFIAEQAAAAADGMQSAFPTVSSAPPPLRASTNSTRPSFQSDGNSPTSTSPASSPPGPSTEYLSPTSTASPHKPIFSSVTPDSTLKQSGTTPDIRPTTTSALQKDGSTTATTGQRAKGRPEETRDDMKAWKRKKKSKEDDRWWRISDDKVKECTTAEVLAMQREVYMLFYEMEKG